ncbi:MAG: tRNA (adenosine(37)-N6)-threonylcarbamoyltransferase complex ATPase subunit type 1 TsaE [Alphaproteobacteria bacterium]|nr:tRNA (adenosine(37)-N6)-threonylcarbamoyltransferase complex ATPase subunit type 1 TsaE [Alphaproteobacteria bacterium]
MDEITLTLHSEKDTQALAASLAKQARVGDIIYLKGTLGMGKSTFARAFIRHLADNPHLEVPSPTFTLVQSYTDLSLPVWHFDLYRLNSPEEIEELGLDEALEHYHDPKNPYGVNPYEALQDRFNSYAHLERTVEWLGQDTGHNHSTDQNKEEAA